jgi:hypothetical protein
MAKVPRQQGAQSGLTPNKSAPVWPEANQSTSYSTLATTRPSTVPALS